MRILKTKQARKRGRLGVISVEYMLVVTFVVIPLGLLAPGIIKMIGLFASRIFGIVGLPFG